ncbi:MAG TPA: amidohydrolase, partial [Pseudohongiella sp.]|nr:amidohydrolase [Pseudohongiella sp.]
MMKIITELVHLAPQMTDWRKTIHRHPELAFNEHHTSALVAEQLKAAGLDPVQGVGGTGVVALIKGREPGPVIALRADMDALPMNDETGQPYASTIPGCSHSCGHDGHTAALIGTAHYLASHPPARGSVLLIFQPAEENGLGAKAMIRDGLLKDYTFDEVYSFHNMPLL